MTQKNTPARPILSDNDKKRLKHIWETANYLSVGNITESYNEIMEALIGYALPTPTDAVEFAKWIGENYIQAFDTNDLWQIKKKLWRSPVKWHTTEELYQIFKKEKGKI